MKKPTLRQIQMYKIISDKAAHKVRVMWQAPDHSTQEEMISEIILAAIGEAIMIGRAK